MAAEGEEPPKEGLPPSKITVLATERKKRAAAGPSISPDARATYEMLELARDKYGVPFPTLANASRVLQRHPEFKGRLWLDSFRQKVYHSWEGEARLWTDADARRVTAWIQQQLELPKITLALMHEAALHAAEAQARNSLTDWLSALKWDGTERLDTWLADCLDVSRSPYNDRVARNWLISMVARAFKPGCQVDTMPVLEGPMGRGKSRFLEILADPWFAAIQIAFGEKDFFQAIQGRWLIEVPDMSGFSRREHTQILATITTRVDVYRKSHGRITEEHPRVTVFAATSETDDYLKDTRGRRRYWPLRCGHIDWSALEKQREQLFAEAVFAYRAGEHWHEMPEGTDAEQIERMEQDLWTEAILNYVDTLDPQVVGNSRKVVAVPSYILFYALKIELKDQTQAEKNRVAGVLQRAGWVASKIKGNRCWMHPSRDTVQ